MAKPRSHVLPCAQVCALTKPHRKGRFSRKEEDLLPGEGEKGCRTKNNEFPILQMREQTGGMIV